MFPQAILRRWRSYRAALSRIFPGKRIAAALVWTEGPSLMPLPNTLLDAEIGAD